MAFDGDLLKHEPLVIKIMSQYGLNKSRDEDVYSEAMMGLVKAANGFRPELGFQFSTYAWRGIQNAILTELRDRKKHSSVNSLSDNILVENTDINIVDNEDGICCLIKTLTEREASVIRRRFSAGHTLNRVGKRFKISKERVRQIQKEALEKLRQQL